jgi:cobalt/nickel transport system permease protein
MSHEHRPDRRLRVAALLLLAFSVALIRSIDTLFILTAFSGAAAVIAVIYKSISLTALIKRIFVINFFVFWIWVTLPIDWPTLRSSPEGVALALELTLRINVIALSGSVLLVHMSGIDFARAIVALGFPQTLGTLLALSLRSIALLENTRARLEQAMRARAYRASFSIRTIRVSAQLVASLIVHALVRGERIRLGMMARSYTTLRWPTRQHSHWHALPLSEWAAFFTVIAALAIALILPRL